MRQTFKPIAAFLTSATALSFTLAACSTEPEVIGESPAEDGSVVSADAPGIGVPNPEGDASPVTAVPGENAYGPEDTSEDEAPSGAEPTNDITADSAMPASSATANETTTTD
ncbi:hypothetical protein [Erythrobacter sp.]|jgi:hypothetical protein|uniref:hypothetical protein n=1 Tax=Erythrobacter sp. TaxID=1042 RepID=UPI002EBB7944|nr:hypothetical protein [Erythrobacter sp.]